MTRSGASFKGYELDAYTDEAGAVVARLVPTCVLFAAVAGVADDPGPAQHLVCIVLVDVEVLQRLLVDLRVVLLVALVHLRLLSCLAADELLMLVARAGQSQAAMPPRLTARLRSA